MTGTAEAPRTAEAKEGSIVLQEDSRDTGNVVTGSRRHRGFYTRCNCTETTRMHAGSRVGPDACTHKGPPRRGHQAWVPTPPLAPLPQAGERTTQVIKLYENEAATAALAYVQQDPELLWIARTIARTSTDQHGLHGLHGLYG